MQTVKNPLPALTLSILTSLLALLVARAADSEEPSGFVALFNGKNFSGWTVPDGDNGHWKVVNGVIDYDARSEAKGDKSLWCARESCHVTQRFARWVQNSFWNCSDLLMRISSEIVY